MRKPPPTGSSNSMISPIPRQPIRTTSVLLNCLICQDAAKRRDQLDHGFSPLRFAQYANDLSTAVYDLAEEAKLRDYGFKSSPHIRQPKLRQPMNELPPNELPSA